MNLRLTALSALVGISLAAFALPSNACFTVIVGKKVSSTGEILVGHNEDNEMRIITSQYWVDPAMHEDGELIEFEPAASSQKDTGILVVADFGAYRLFIFRWLRE